MRLATSGSVGWYKAWTLGEWSSPDPVAVFELFSANAVALGDIGRAKGAFRWINALAHRLRDNAPGKARQNIAAHYDLGNDFYSAWLDSTMTYSSARFASRRDSLEAAQLDKMARCSTGSSSSLASACSRSAAAGARSRSKRPGAAPWSWASHYRGKKRPGQSERSPKPACRTRSTSASRTIATPPNNSMRSRR